jgi:hypothetical protein
MKAKWISRGNIEKTRPDWQDIQFKVMQFALEVKLSQNWERFGRLLKATENQNIVELTKKDKIWGAIKTSDMYVGVNALGRLLMSLRDKYVITNQYQKCVHPPAISNFLLLGKPIEMVCAEYIEEEIAWSLSKKYVEQY